MIGSKRIGLKGIRSNLLDCIRKDIGKDLFRENRIGKEQIRKGLIRRRSDRKRLDCSRFYW